MTDFALADSTSAAGGRAPSATGDLSLFVFASVLMRRWRLLLSTMLLFGALAAAFALHRAPAYVASAAFIPQGSDNARGGLAGLAGQLGVALPTSTQGPFYVELLSSRELLAPIVRDTFTITQPERRHATLIDLLEVKGTTPDESELLAVRALRRMIDAGDSKTGVVRLSVSTRWPAVSQHVAEQMLTRLNEFNLKTRQSQAGEERRFVGERLAIARVALRNAEDVLKRFLQSNRQYMNSPELTFEHDRLQREASLDESLVSTLATSYEDARTREVRDIPVFTVIEPPRVPSTPEPSFWWLYAFLGMLVGGLLSAFWSLASYAAARRRLAGDRDAAEFLDLLSRVGRRPKGVPMDRPRATNAP